MTRVLGGYLYQGWNDEFDSDISALQAAAASEPSDLRQGVARTIDEFLGKPATEAELKEVLIGRVGCYYNPEAEGLTYAQWLKRVREILAPS